MIPLLTLGKSYTTAPVSERQPWRIWVNRLQKSTKIGRWYRHNYDGVLTWRLFPHYFPIAVVVNLDKPWHSCNVTVSTKQSTVRLRAYLIWNTVLYEHTVVSVQTCGVSMLTVHFAPLKMSTLSDPFSACTWCQSLSGTPPAVPDITDIIYMVTQSCR